MSPGGGLLFLLAAAAGILLSGCWLYALNPAASFAERLALLPFAVIIVAEVLGWRLVEVVAIVNNGLRRFRQAALLVIIGSGLRTVAALLFAAFGRANLEIWAFAYCGATMASALIALLAFLPRTRWRFVRNLYPRRMADAVFAGAADIVFYVQSELDKLLVLGLAGERTAGLYAIAAFEVARRQYEMGVRSSLGATAGHLRALVLRHVFAPVLTGIAGGGLCAWWSATVVQALIFEVDARSPWLFSAVATILALTALAAIWAPARRAARTDPAVVLR